MAMSAGSTDRERAEINVTPMIDVLLVLLVIFMVISPLSPAGLPALIPEAPPPDRDLPPRPRDIVITVRGDGTVQINQETVEMGALKERLRRIFGRRGDDVIFVRGDKDVEFRQVGVVIDIARGAGITRVALMPAP